MSQMAYKTGSTAEFKTQPNKIKPTKKALKKTNKHTIRGCCTKKPGSRFKEAKSRNMVMWRKKS